MVELQLELVITGDGVAGLRTFSWHFYLLAWPRQLHLDDL